MEVTVRFIWWIATMATLFVFNGTALGDGWATSNGTGRITSISPEGGIVRIWFTATDTSNPDGCGNSGVVVLNDETKNGDRQYAALLAAHVAGKPISFFVAGCWSGWGSTWPKMYSVFVGQ